MSSVEGSEVKFLGQSYDVGLDVTVYTPQGIAFLHHRSQRTYRLSLVFLQSFLFWREHLTYCEEFHLFAVVDVEAIINSTSCVNFADKGKKEL